MEYALDYGGVEQQILRDCRLSGMPIPDKIKNAPELLPGLELYITAFYMLSSDRHMGMEAGRIPWTAVARYAEFYSFDDEQTQFLFAIIPELDGITLERGKRGEAK